MRRTNALSHLATLIVLALPACAGTCSETPPPPPGAPPPSRAGAAASAGQPTEMPGRNMVSREANTLHERFKLTLARKTRNELFSGSDSRPFKAFDPADVGRRFWVSYGEGGLVVNDRKLMEHGRLDEAALERALRDAIPDWTSRSGVAPAAALLVMDRGTDLRAASAINRATRTAGGGAWRVSALMLDDEGKPVEVFVDSPVSRGGTRGGEGTEGRAERRPSAPQPAPPPTQPAPAPAGRPAP